MAQYYYNNIGNIKVIYEELGFSSMEKFADSIGKSREAIEKWQYHITPMSFIDIELICRPHKLALNCLLQVKGGEKYTVEQMKKWYSPIYLFGDLMKDTKKALKIKRKEDFMKQYGLHETTIKWMSNMAPECKKMHVDTILQMCNDACIDLNNYIIDPNMMFEHINGFHRNARTVLRVFCIETGKPFHNWYNGLKQELHFFK